MPGVAQRRTKLAGTVYDRGDEVPDSLITSRTLAMGLVAVSSSGDDRAEVERLKAELEETKAKLAEIEARSTTAGGKRKAGAKSEGTDDTGGDAGGE